MLEFQAWPKTPRLSAGGMTITEKIDGTNACVVIMPVDHPADTAESLDGVALVELMNDARTYVVGAQSRKKMITPGKSTDNAGFAYWVSENARELVDLLGPGYHFGEWWGQGIQRGYGLDRKVFSLFNTHKWEKISLDRPDWWERAIEINLNVVPVLYNGVFSDQAIRESLDRLDRLGSHAALRHGVQFNRPEGVIIRHQSLGGNLKAFIENDDVPKGLQ